MPKQTLQRPLKLTYGKSLFEQLPERLRQIKGRRVPSKKRSASSAKSGNAPSRPRGVAEEAVKQRRSDELNRPMARTVSEHQPRVPLRTSSFDTARIQQQHGTPTFSSSFPDIIPMDMSSVGDRSETGSIPGGMQPANPQAHNFVRMQPQPVPGNNTLYKLDAMMFPTGDPFAYPNQQPLMDFPAQSPQGQQPGGHGGDGPGHHHAASMQFYIPSLYDDIEGQLLGPIPSYIQPQQHHRGTPQQQGMTLNSQMYNTGMLGMSAQGPSQEQQQQGMAPTPQQRQQRELDAMLAGPNFRGDWGDMMGNPGGYRQS